MVLMTLTDTCADCRHESVKHDEAFGCRNSYEKDGEKYFCVCVKLIEV
jgi:hypothetical protein